METLVNILLAGLVLFLVSLKRTYQAVPIRELKRRAREGDELAEALFKAVGYGHSLNTVLWFLVLASSALFFVSVSMSAPVWVALITCGMVAWLGFVWLPARRVSRLGKLAARHLAGPLAWLLNYLHPLLDRFHRFIERHRPVSVHTGMYDRDDLIDLLELQKVQADNRIDGFLLEVAKHSLTFGDILVRDVLVPRRVVKSVSASEPLGPVLLDELHDSGHSRFPVYEENSDNIVGVLLLRDLITSAKQSGMVQRVMRPTVCYMHEEQTLAEALQAVLKTHQHLFIVVNSFEEYVGIITIEDILERIVGKPIIDEFDEYEDLRAVAAVIASKEHKAHQETNQEEKLPSEASEVVE